MLNVHAVKLGSVFVTSSDLKISRFDRTHDFKFFMYSNLSTQESYYGFAFVPTEPAPAVLAAAKTVLSCQSFALSLEMVYSFALCVVVDLPCRKDAINVCFFTKLTPSKF